MVCPVSSDPLATTLPVPHGLSGNRLPGRPQASWQFPAVQMATEAVNVVLPWST